MESWVASQFRIVDSFPLKVISNVVYSSWRFMPLNMPQRNLLSWDKNYGLFRLARQLRTFCTVANERWASKLDMGSSITTTVSARLDYGQEMKRITLRANVLRSPLLSEFRNDVSPGVLVLLLTAIGVSFITTLYVHVDPVPPPMFVEVKFPIRKLAFKRSGNGLLHLAIEGRRWSGTHPGPFWLHLVPFQCAPWPPPQPAKCRTVEQYLRGP